MHKEIRKAGKIIKKMHKTQNHSLEQILLANKAFGRQQTVRRRIFGFCAVN